MFASVTFQCETAECPNSQIGDQSIILKLTENGELPWLVCGVCQVDIIPNPNAAND